MKSSLWNFSGKIIGILGGGQLGKMLLYITRKWDIKTKVMDPNDDAPSRIGCDKFVIGDLMNYQNVIDFGEDVDILTIEIENINTEALDALEKEGLKFIHNPQFLK